MKKALIFYGLLLSAGMLQGMNTASWQNPFSRYFNSESFNTISRQAQNLFESGPRAIGQYAYNNPKTTALGALAGSYGLYYAWNQYLKRLAEKQQAAAEKREQESAAKIYKKIRTIAAELLGSYKNWKNINPVSWSLTEKNASSEEITTSFSKNLSDKAEIDLMLHEKIPEIIKNEVFGDKKLTTSEDFKLFFDTILNNITEIKDYSKKLPEKKPNEIEIINYYINTIKDIKNNYEKARSDMYKVLGKDDKLPRQPIPNNDNELIIFLNRLNLSHKDTLNHGLYATAKINDYKDFLSHGGFTTNSIIKLLSYMHDHIDNFKNTYQSKNMLTKKISILLEHYLLTINIAVATLKQEEAKREDPVIQKAEKSQSGAFNQNRKKPKKRIMAGY